MLLHRLYYFMSDYGLFHTFASFIGMQHSSRRRHTGSETSADYGRCYCILHFHRQFFRIDSLKTNMTDWAPRKLVAMLRRGIFITVGANKLADGRTKRKRKWNFTVKPTLCVMFYSRSRHPSESRLLVTPTLPCVIITLIACEVLQPKRLKERMKWRSVLPAPNVYCAYRISEHGLAYWRRRLNRYRVFSVCNVTQRQKKDAA